MAAKKETHNHVIKINGQVSRSDGSITEKQRRALKKKKKKKLKSIGKRHPEFELTYDMMLGIRYAVSLSEPSVTTTTTRTRTVTATHTVTTTKSSHTLDKTRADRLRDKNLSIYAQYGASASGSTSHSTHVARTDDSDIDMSSSALDMSSDDTDSGSDDDRLIESEFLETKKYKFPSSGSETTPAHQMSDFKFKDYCPQIFRQLREWFRISTQEYLVTICGDFKLLEFISNSKSGQFFFFSHNSQFIIKTMTRTESIFLRKILPSYYTYVSQQPDTLLPKFYGMHRVKRKKQKIYFLIQQNVFYSDVDDIHDQYDLKGSTQGRRATKAERKKGAILKDLDWVDEHKQIKIGSQRAKLFRDQLKRDTHWLRREKIMDYSLLVGIHYLNRARVKHLPQPQHQMLIDHSVKPPMYDEEEEDDEEEQKYDTRLKPVEESKETPEEEEEAITNDEDHDTLMLEASTTEHTADDEAIISPIEERRHSVDEAMFNVEKSASTRRNSAPTVLTPRELVDVNSANRYKFKEYKSQSLQLKNERETSEWLDELQQEKPPQLQITNSNKKYRGHISVKHPKRYKRKTAAEMQFAVDDIDIPKGIKHEVSGEMSDVVQKNEIDVVEEIVSIEMKQINEENEQKTDENDICPWTTYHGGMRREKEDGMSNEIYFIGLIDILQKYNKRKKK
eukprot:77980_1